MCDINVDEQELLPMNKNNEHSSSHTLRRQSHGVDSNVKLLINRNLFINKNYNTYTSRLPIPGTQIFYGLKQPCIKPKDKVPITKVDSLILPQHFIIQQNSWFIIRKKFDKTLELLKKNATQSGKQINRQEYATGNITYYWFNIPIVGYLKPCEEYQSTETSINQDDDVSDTMFVQYIVQMPENGIYGKRYDKSKDKFANKDFSCPCCRPDTKKINQKYKNHRKNELLQFCKKYSSQCYPDEY